jgi:hypothetical protein
MAKPQKSKPSDGPSAEPIKAVPKKDLPVVEAPKLDGSEPSAQTTFTFPSNETTKPAGEVAASQPPVARSLRFALLAASVGFAAALGAVVGSLSASGLLHLSPAATEHSDAEANALQAIKTELAELSALKASLDSATRGANSQFAKLADRLDRVERAQIDPATKLSHIADAIDRLEKKAGTPSAAAAAPETTGSIAASPPPAPSAPTETKPSDRVVQDWIVQSVRGNRALVASRYGGIFVVASGSLLPGLGHVETIKRQDGQWIVVTERGVITSDR